MLHFYRMQILFFNRIVNNAFGIPAQHLIIILLNENLTVIELVNIIKKEKKVAFPNHICFSIQKYPRERSLILKQ